MSEPVEDSLDREPDEYMRMQLSLLLYSPRKEVANAILNAYNSKEWDWRNSDGCTLVSECHFPEGVRFPPCVLHDHQWWLVKQGMQTAWKANRLFYLAQIDYGISVVRAGVRWVGVTVSWFSWFKWI